MNPTKKAQGWIRRLAWRVVGILASLELPPEKGCAWEFHTDVPLKETGIGSSIHFAKVASSCFRETVWFLRLTGKYGLLSLKSLAISLLARCQASVSVFLQAKGQTWRFWRRSCLKSDAQKDGASSLDNQPDTGYKKDVKF